MPRKSRIDAPGALHHIIARGINRRQIFDDDEDRDRFVARLGELLLESGTGCYAWALIPNHFHLLLRTGRMPLARMMRRLLTGHAVTYNLRHRRSGHLFQNRYKSILCQEDVYLLELVRYIHLNPLRAKVVDDLKALERYPYSGHGVLLGRQLQPWQETAAVLRRFERNVRSARRIYRQFVAKGAEMGRLPELVGGGLVRSMGGWSEVRELRKAKAYMKGDERILGDSDFVTEVLSSAEEEWKRAHALRASGLDVDKVAHRVAEVLGMEVKAVWEPGRRAVTVQARSLLSYWCVRALGVSMSALARRMGISVTAVSKAVQRGAKIAEEGEFHLE
jgi:REP element-mobilizing transposase RayT/biotin operon repressor